MQAIPAPRSRSAWSCGYSWNSAWYRVTKVSLPWKRVYGPNCTELSSTFSSVLCCACLPVYSIQPLMQYPCKSQPKHQKNNFITMHRVQKHICYEYWVSIRFFQGDDCGWLLSSEPIPSMLQAPTATQAQSIPSIASQPVCCHSGHIESIL